MNVRRICAVSMMIVLAALVGCASGGGSQTGTGAIETTAGSTASSTTSTTDAQGFERNLGPAEIAYQSAKQFMSAGNYTEAIANLEKAVSIKPAYLEAWSDLGRAYSDRKDYEKGIAAYEKALELSPGNEALIAQIGYNYLNLEQYDKAAEYYGMLVQKDPNNYIGNVNLAFIAQRNGNNSDAITYYEKALESNPTDATTMGTLANLYGERGDTAKRYEYLERAIEAAPDNHQFKKQLARAYFNDKNYEKAVPLYESLVTIYPDDADLHKRLGFALSQTDRKNEAPAELEKAIELGAGDSFTWAILAKIYNENGMYQKAIDASKSGLALKQGEAAFLNYQWGEALSKLGDYEGAIVRFEQVVSMRDATWSGPAEKQIERQQKLIQRRKAEKEKEMYE
jgi:tetratricopeptide (TPR) repeat protein